MADERLRYFIEALWKGKGDVAAARRDLKGLGEAGEQGAKGVKRADDAGLSLGGTLRTLAATGVVVGAGQQLLSFGRDAINTASDVAEMQSKFDTVFGDQAGSVTAQLGEFAEAANRSVTDLQGFGATLQDTFVPLGFARDEAADMSVASVKLAEDLASFNNLNTAEVVRDIQSALVGNTETLRKYGVVASQAAIEEEALASGLIASKDELDAVTKAQAIYQLTLKGTTDAQGDAIRTADSYANKQKGLQAALTDLQVVIGETLIPVATEMVDVLAQMADQATTSAKAVGGEMADSVEEMVTANVQGARSTEELRAEYESLNEAWETAGFVGRLLTGTTDELNAGYGLLAQQVIETSDSYADFEERGAEVFGSSGELNRALEQLKDNYALVTGNIQPTNEELFRFYEETAQAADQAGILAEKMDRVATASANATEEVGLLGGRVDLTTVEFDDLALVVGNATTATDNLRNALQTFAKEQYRSKVEVDGLDSALAKARALRQELTGVRTTRSGNEVDVGGGTGSTAGKGADARAFGGPVAGGMPYLVGERGPEIFVPTANGSIVPNNQMGGGTVNITVNVNASGRGRGMARQIAAAVGEVYGGLN